MWQRANIYIYYSYTQQSSAQHSRTAAKYGRRQRRTGLLVRRSLSHYTGYKQSAYARLLVPTSLPTTAPWSMRQRFCQWIFTSNSCVSSTQGYHTTIAPKRSLTLPALASNASFAAVVIANGDNALPRRRTTWLHGAKPRKLREMHKPPGPLHTQEWSLTRGGNAKHAT